MDTSVVFAAVSEHAREKGCAVHEADRLSADLGYDSMSKVELAVDLEERLGVPVPDSVVTRALTVGDLLAALPRS
jgi:acyl carrier protein